MTDGTHFRTCPLCEATCGLEITVRHGAVVRIRGDRDDVFSRGFICPKGSALKHLHEDPTRLRVPHRRTPEGHVPITWEEAWAEIGDRLGAIRAEHGPDSVGVYLGNPNVHSLAAPLFLPHLLRALKTRNLFSASTVDQVPRNVSTGLMFGDPYGILLPDIDRTSFLLLLGANLRPGTDALFLCALANVISTDGLVDLGDAEPHLNGVDEALAAVAPWTPERVAEPTGIDAATIRRLAHELAAADRAVVYGRIGVHTVRGGTVASWATDLLTTITGNHSRRLERALTSLDFMVSIDLYLNETTRHAEVVLPVPSHLEKATTTSSSPIRRVDRWRTGHRRSFPPINRASARC